MPPLFLAALGLLPRAAGAEILMTRGEALALAFPADAKVAPKPLTLTAEQRGQVEQVLGARIYSPYCEFYEARVGKDLLGWALVDEELGKHQPITFLVAMDAKARVQHVAVMTYREHYGGGVRAPSFTRQFTGKTGREPLKVGKDIDAVAGATISSKALCLGVRKASLLAGHLFLGQAYPKP